MRYLFTNDPGQKSRGSKSGPIVSSSQWGRSDRFLIARSPRDFGSSAGRARRRSRRTGRASGPLRDDLVTVSGALPRTGPRPPMPCGSEVLRQTSLARIIHEPVPQTSQLGSGRCFGTIGPGGDLDRSSSTPIVPRCQQGPRNRRSRSVGAFGVRVHE